MKKSIRDIKNGLQNFARNEDEGLSKKQLLFKKCAIINTQLSNNAFRHKDWKAPDRTPSELIQFLEGVEADYAGNGMVIELCSHLINVLEYLMDDRGVVEPPKYGLAVRKPTEALRAFINQDKDYAKEDYYSYNDSLWELGKRMREAARCGKLDEVKTLVEFGVNVNSTDGDNRTALMEAAEWGGKDKGVSVIRYLLSQGANINAQDREGYTTLQCAICSDNTSAIKVLLEAGAELDTMDRWGEIEHSSLLLAVSHLTTENVIPTIKALIAAGADVNVVVPICNRENNYEPSDGDTALITAIKRKDKSEQDTLSIVKILVEAGADVTKKGQDGTALDVAVYEHKSEIVGYLETVEGAGSLREEVSFDLFKEFRADCIKKTEETWGKSVIKSMSMANPNFIVVDFYRVARDIIKCALYDIESAFKKTFGYKPKRVSYNGELREAIIYTI